MEPHNHPKYEQTFERVATILDVIATEQAEMQRGQAELQRGQAAFQRSQAELQRGHARLQDGHEKLQAIVAGIGLKLDEATDKLNALIDLMNRHIAEDHNR